VSWERPGGRSDRALEPHILLTEFVYSRRMSFDVIETGSVPDQQEYVRRRVQSHIPFSET